MGTPLHRQDWNPFLIISPLQLLACRTSIVHDAHLEEFYPRVGLILLSGKGRGRKFSQVRPTMLA
jgi:hypothetical protein